MKKCIALIWTLCFAGAGTFFAAADSNAGERNSAAAVLAESEKGILCEAGQTLRWDFTLSLGGRYRPVLEYRAAFARNVTPRAEIAVDGGEAFAFDLPRKWVISADSLGADGRFAVDDLGNERIPRFEDSGERQILTPTGWDDSMPEFSAGTHRLEFTAVLDAVILYSVRLEPVTEPMSYSQYEALHRAKSQANRSVTWEAEILGAKSHPEIAPTFDRISPAVSPNHPSKIRYNLLGGARFGIEGRWAEWTVEVPETGLYELDVTYRQSINRGLSTRHKITVDGEVPFAECAAIDFAPSDDFRTLTLADERGKPFRFYLTAGRHVFRTEVVLTGLKEVPALLTEIVKELNTLYTRIAVIVGKTADAYRDYDLPEHIPGLTATLRNSASRLDDAAALTEAGGDGGDTAARIREAARMLRSLADSPRKIPGRLDRFRAQIHALADLTGDLRIRPLELDKWTLRAPARAPAEPRAGFAEYLRFRLAAFIKSFFADYGAVGRADNGRGRDALNVWVGANDRDAAGFAVGRDQAQILARLTADFTAESGIPVNVSLVSAADALLPALVSGKGPDAALFVPKNLIANLYFREGLVNLRAEMPDFDRVIRRFYPSALISAGFGEGVYALPEVQIFNMMFVRTDILEEQGLTPPQTWSEFYSVVARLQNRGMQAGIAESNRIFEMFLLQNGGKLYDESVSQTRLTEPAAVGAFAAWTNLYAKYGLPQAFDAFNRFRSGETPLVLTSVHFYGQLAVGAPELSGRWAMLPVPGTPGGEGIDRSEVCETGGAVVPARSRRRAEALRFLDWWTSDETQIEFAFECEMRLGVSGRYYSANKAVLPTLSLTADEAKALETQWAAVSDVPRSPAHYYIERSLTNAFRRAVYNRENPRDVIFRYGKAADDELARKNREFGLIPTESRR